MTTPITTKYTASDLAAQYGYAAAFFNSVPELKSILDVAVREQWTPDRFRAKFMDTQWYKINAQPYKQWVELKTRNPAEAQRQIDQKAVEIGNLAKQMGARDRPDGYKAFAEQALWSGWSEAQIRQVMVDWNYDNKGTGGAGQAGTVDQTVRRVAGDYGVGLTDAQVTDFTRGILKGSMSEDNVAAFAKQMAMSKYAGMRGYLEQGFTVRQVASPYLQSYSQLMEVTPESVNLNDGLIQKALQGSPDPKSGGVPVMQSLWQFEKSVRQDKRWLGTKNARDEAENIATKVAQDWGIHG